MKTGPPDFADTQQPHPRVMGWLGTTALAMGGSNQMLFLVSALIIGQGSIPGQGSAAVLCLIAGLILGWMALPGWTELILMWPNRVGGIAATCGEAFRPYAPVLGNLTGMCYWWGWVPTCGVCALLSAGAIHSWFLPSVSISAVATGIVLFFMVVNLCGVKWIVRLTVPIACVSATLAFLAAAIPMWTGHVDWHQALTFHLTVPFPGWFGKLTSAMAGLYLVGFAAPAFEAAACHVGETVDQNKNVPRAMFAAATMATLFFLVLPVVWLGAIGSDAMAGDLTDTLGPVYAPLFGAGAKAAAVAFMVFNMFHGTIAPLTGVCRTLSQLSEDGLLPRFFAKRIRRTDAPWVATLVTAVCSIAFLWIGDPVWLIAAANLTYLIGISLPSVAVWLLRRDQPDMPRPYCAPRGTIMLGLLAALGWGISTVLGFQQFGLPPVIFGLVLAYSGAILYAWRRWEDYRRSGKKGVPHSLHVKLTGAMMTVLIFDGVGYYIAVQNAGNSNPALITALEDIFVIVALLTITVGLVLPGMIAHAAVEVMKSASKLANGTLADLSKAMAALAAGNLDEAHARVDISPVIVHTKDELGQMAASFNIMQEEIERTAKGLDGAREGLRDARRQLEQNNAILEERVKQRTAELEVAGKKLVETAWHAGKAEVAIGVLHNVGNVLNSINVSASMVEGKVRKSRVAGLTKAMDLIGLHESDLGQFLANDERGRQLPGYLAMLAKALTQEQADVLGELESLTKNVEHIKEIVNTQQSYASAATLSEPLNLRDVVEEAIGMNTGALSRHSVTLEREYSEVPVAPLERHKLLQILVNLINNAKWAIGAGTNELRRITVRVGQHNEDRLFVEIADTGIGISAEDSARIFEHGFSRREGGHGFGLHSSAVTAISMGGTLRVCSAGINQGATFRLEIPCKTANAKAA